MRMTRVVDRLLASPHFGERWGRHWLDVARFAESSGGGRSLLFKDAWRYRDYVIQLGQRRQAARSVHRRADCRRPAAARNRRPRRREHLIATAYLLLGAHNYEEQDKRALEMDVVDEQIDTIGRGLLGMTVACARCHDHKFDPIPTTDYYALAGIFRRHEDARFTTTFRRGRRGTCRSTTMRRRPLSRSTRPPWPTLKRQACRRPRRRPAARSRKT